jgi:prepilin-type N-terminal cleavage/methylation domain-containing protein
MLKKLLKSKEGFTIIEVLIVMAIAGLILLIVFLAVPALQRNSRNTQRKNDIANMLGAISEWSNNNRGALPNTAALFFAASGNADLGFYAKPTSATALGDFDFATSTTALTTTQLGVISKVYVRVGAKCNATFDNITGTGASSRNIAVVYTVETGGANQNICQES